LIYTLEVCVPDITNNHAVTSHEPLMANNISWNYFHQTMAEIECVVYGAILSEVIKRAIGMGKKKKPDAADASDAVSCGNAIYAKAPTMTLN
jgi:hypothetical protein